MFYSKAKWPCSWISFFLTHTNVILYILTTCGDFSSTGALANKKCNTVLYGMISPKAGLIEMCSTDWNNNGLQMKEQKWLWRSLHLSS